MYLGTVIHTCAHTNGLTYLDLQRLIYVSIVLSSGGIDKKLLYLDLAPIMYIFSNFALFKVPYTLHFKLFPRGYFSLKCTLWTIMSLD